MKKSLFCFCLAVVFWHGYAFAGYVDNNDGTITDTSTGLMWEKSTGLTTYTWDQAKAYCENLTLGGQSDWRLPTRNELQSIVDYNSYDPSISTTFFPDTVASYYWSSTVGANSTGNAWRVGFGYGSVYDDGKTNGSYVRAVRAGQCGSFGDSDGDGVSDEDDECPDTPLGTNVDSSGCPKKFCPAQQVLGADNLKLGQLRYFRDHSLAQSAIGRKVIQIYYKNADTINAGFDRSPALRAVSRRVLEVIAPMLGRQE